MQKDKLRVIGKPVPLMEAYEKVTGKCEYVNDIKLGPVLHVKILRSPHPHAIIKEIDTSRAEELEGVKAVLTHKDVPRRLMPRGCGRACYILEEHVRFVGDEVAAVAAETEEVAEDALDLIEVEYEILPAVFDPEKAAEKGAPKLYPEGNVYGPQIEPLVEKGIDKPVLLEWGDIDKGFKVADVVAEDKFELKPQVHTPIETHVCIAKWEGGQLTIWNPNQCPYEVRDGVAYALGMGESNVRVISKNVGAGFGNKYLERYIPITALLSKKTGGRPTKILFTIEEETCHVKRADCKVYVKIGAKKDGTITAIQLKAYFGLGGYGNPIGGTCAFWEETPAISYKAENVRFEGWDVHTNHFSTQPYRSVHTPALCLSLEQVIDEVAEKLGMDPAELRIKNMPDTGETMPPKPYINNSIGYVRAKLDVYPAKKVMKKVMEEIDWKKRWKGWGKPSATDGKTSRGVGIAYSNGWGGYCFDGFMTMTVALNKDGSVDIMSGAQDIGTGLNTSLRMLVAENLQIPLENVAIHTGDTATGQYDFFGARASRELTTGGHLLLAAVEDAKKKIREFASERLEVGPEEIEIGEKKAYVKECPERSIPLPQLLTTSIVGSASGSPGSIFPEPEPGTKARQPLVLAAEVEVDTETGQVRPISLVMGNCPGRVINPDVVRGQYIGGAIQTMSLALYEEFKYDEKTSRYLSNNLVDYRVPRALDLDGVEIESIVLEEVAGRKPHEGTPYGAMAVGELSCWGTVAAIANAIYDAIGVRSEVYPFTPEKILEKMERKGIAK